MQTKRKLKKRYLNKQFLLALGSHCRKLRVKRGLSIDRMSKEGEQLSPGAIQRLETGAADVQVSLLLRYAQILEIPLKELFSFQYELDADLPEIIPFEEGRSQPKNSVPYYAIEVAAGSFKNENYILEPQGWVVVNKKGSLKEYFAAQVSGRSMEPTIRSGQLCLFKKYSGGSRNGLIMLVQARGLIDPDTGGSFVLKRYQRITPVSESSSRQNAIVHLLSDNPKFAPIVLKGLREDEISTPAVFVEAL